MRLIEPNEAWASLSRSWERATGMQLATLATLTAAYSTVVFGLIVGLNMRRALSTWGESVQITAYLRESADPTLPDRVRRSLAALPEAGAVDFVAKERATELFRAQMAAYAPDLLADKDFANPFPASFHLKLKPDAPASTDPDALESLAATVQKIEGVEDVSYGQSWVRNYAILVRVGSVSGWALAAVLATGALFVVGNSIRASIGVRRDEIAILELVGATSAMIRAPYVFEGAAMGLAASLLALVLNFAVWSWELQLLRGSFAVSRLVDGLTFLSPVWIGAALVSGAALGALGAYLIVRTINDGWAASQGFEA